MVAPDRTQALELIRCYRPQDRSPLHTLDTWLRELAELSCDAKFGPSVLGIPLTDEVITATCALLRGDEVDVRLAMLIPRTQIFAALFR